MSLPDINPDGSEVVVTLLYVRYGGKLTEEHDTIEEAKHYAEHLVDCNEGAPVAIVIDGEVKCYNRYNRLRYEWVLPDEEEMKYIQTHWPEVIRKAIRQGDL